MRFAARRGAGVLAPRGLWMRSTSDNARNVEALCSLSLSRPTTGCSLFPTVPAFVLPPRAVRSAAAHLSSKLATASGALRVDERCAGVLRRDGSSNTSQYAVLHVEWQTGIHASNLRERSGRGRSDVVDRKGGGEWKFRLRYTTRYCTHYRMLGRVRPSVVVRENGSCRSALRGTTIRCISDCTGYTYMRGYICTHVRIYAGVHVCIYNIYIYTYICDPRCRR